MSAVCPQCGFALPRMTAESVTEWLMSIGPRTFNRAEFGLHFGASGNAVTHALTRLTREGVLDRVGRGRYRRKETP